MLFSSCNLLNDCLRCHLHTYVLIYVIAINSATGLNSTGWPMAHKSENTSVLFIITHVMLVSATKLSEKLLEVLIKMFNVSAVISNHEFQTTMPLIINSINK